MAIASVREVIEAERGASATDDEIARLLRASRIKPLPKGHHHWTRVAGRAVMGEDPAGHRADGSYGGAVR